jgi:Clr5 domain
MPRGWDVTLETWSMTPGDCDNTPGEWCYERTATTAIVISHPVNLVGQLLAIAPDVDTSPAKADPEPDTAVPFQQQSSYAQPDQWDSFRPIITDLYQRLTLPQVVKEMKEQHGFVATYENSRSALAVPTLLT